MYIQKSNIIYYHLTEYTNISVITEGNHKDILYIHFYLQRYLEAPFMKLPEYIQRSDYLLICRLLSSIVKHHCCLAAIHIYYPSYSPLYNIVSLYIPIYYIRFVCSLNLCYHF